MKIDDSSVHDCTKHIYAKIDIDTDIIQNLIITESYKYTYHNEKCHS